MLNLLILITSLFICICAYFQFVLRATSLSVFYTVKCHPRKIKLINKVDYFIVNLLSEWRFPLNGHSAAHPILDKPQHKKISRSLLVFCFLSVVQNAQWPRFENYLLARSKLCLLSSGFQCCRLESQDQNQSNYSD